MFSTQKSSLLLLRFALGWYFFYAGISKIIDPAWSAAGYISGAKTFPGFYHLLLSPGLLSIVNIFNEWGLTLLGLALIFGIFVRLGSLLGILVMILYYLPALHFPYVGDHAYIIDEHIIYIAAMLVLASFHSGDIWGLGRFVKRFGAWAQ